MMRIAVTDTMGSEHKFRNYVSWMEGADRNIECVRLSYANGNAGLLSECGGLLLTGGHDVDPGLYGGETGDPLVTGIDPRRDEFELHLLRDALDRKLPILGVCRGLQLTNVFFRGSLVPDLERAGYQSHKSETDDSEYEHEVSVLDGSALRRIVGCSGGRVSSSHHQGVARVGEGLSVSSRSADGVIESLEQVSEDHFLLLVQWHPERMRDAGSPFAAGIRNSFLSMVARQTRELKSTLKE